MIELRGIIVRVQTSGPKVEFQVRDNLTGVYSKITFPPGKQLNKAGVISEICQQMNIPQGKVVWPAHVKIPDF